PQSSDRCCLFAGVPPMTDRDPASLVRSITDVQDAFARTTAGWRSAIESTAKAQYHAIERIEALEARTDLPRGVSTYSRADDEHKSTFIDWVRKPSDPRRIARLSEAQDELSKKDVTIGSNPGGGYALPKEISAAIEV